MRQSRPPLDRTFFETVYGLGIQLPGPLLRYLRTILGVEPNEEILSQRRMEEVFKEVFFDLQEEGTTAIHSAYIDLIDLYLRVLRETTNWLCEDGRDGAPVGRLLAAAAAGDDLTVVTFNHDLNIENEIARRALLRRRWCLDMGYGAFQAKLSLIVPRTSSPVLPLHAAGGCDHTRPIRILKLHGSLNWVVRMAGDRPTVNFLTGQSATGQIHLLPTRTITSARNIYVRTAPGRGRNRWPLWPVVVPPVYAKQALRSAVQEAWDEARTRLENADRVVFFGYSLPEIDVEAEKLFERALARNVHVPWLDVVDPSPDAARRYAGLATSRPVRWYPTLGTFLARQDLVNA
jgi:hypothetical protein